MADENVSRLLEEQKRERMANLDLLRKLEKQLDAKQKLELQIEQLKGKSQVMEDIKKEIAEIKVELDAKVEEINYMQALNQDLITKERTCNDELQEARTELIMGLKETFGGHASIGIKRIGELDEKPFRKACKRKFPKYDAEVKAAMLCSDWQEKLKNPAWHPFKVIIHDGKEKFLDPFTVDHFKMRH
ncbi:hypothetical protein J5N97_005832 [Dioscorea zingiberensis]|uniref:Factor of DNA methylation 1-5/IDN2 domain-containing protein n=1 Tax=Dioscorea zingiberensis TaxID=325984 RepID=A0A9D5D978_9LILI|nr:hypothetical protein J5N97_005832 [Dioscorea zingiberensis]